MSSPNIRVLHLVLSFRPGGRRNAILALAKGMRGSVSRCDLCCLDELGCDTEEIGGHFDSISVLHRPTTARVRLVQRLRALCQDRGINLIHTHDAASQLTAALVRLTRPRTKLLMTFHRSLGFESARRRDRIRNAFACSLSGGIVTASAERRSHFLSENAVPERKVSVIPLGIDTQAFFHDPKRRSEIRSGLKIGPRTVLVGAVGHFGWEKGIDLAIRSFGEMCKRTPQLDAMLVVLGDGSSVQLSAIKSLVASQPAGKVILAGFQSNISHWYSSFDILLHSPRLEAFGMVIIESMAAGLPVVATRVGGVPELVRHEQTGLLCEPESISALGDALERLVKCRDLREQLGARAREVADHEYRASLATERYLALYHRLIAGEDCRSDSVGLRRESNRIDHAVTLLSQETVR